MPQQTKLLPPLLSSLSRGLSADTAYPTSCCPTEAHASSPNCYSASLGECIGVKKVNTSAYHPQSDGLVERFNRTLTDMLAKSLAPGTMEWDERLPYVLFAYRAALQTSTGESPFFLLYGREPQLPSEAVLSPPVHRSDIELDDYKSTMVREMGTAWDLAKETIGKAQKRQ